MHDAVERALAALDGRAQGQAASSPAPRPNIDKAYELVEAMAARVRGHLAEIDALVLAGPRGRADAAARATDDQLEL